MRFLDFSGPFPYHRNQDTCVRQPGGSCFLRLSFRELHFIRAGQMWLDSWGAAKPRFIPTFPSRSGENKTTSKGDVCTLVYPSLAEGRLFLGNVCFCPWRVNTLLNVNLYQIFVKNRQPSSCCQMHMIFLYWFTWSFAKWTFLYRKEHCEKIAHTGGDQWPYFISWEAQTLADVKSETCH